MALKYPVFLSLMVQKEIYSVLARLLVLASDWFLQGTHLKLSRGEEKNNKKYRKK